MFDPIQEDQTMGLLSRALDLLSIRHSLLASNIANVDTPGYRAVDLDFKAELEESLNRSTFSSAFQTVSNNPFSSGSLMPRIFEVEERTARVDGNSVDIDSQLVKLAKVTALYTQASRFLSAKLRMLKSAIGEEV
jgi:flagellar basal-body rod protein FlgB